MTETGSEGALAEPMARRLSRRAPLPLDPRGGIAIKRSEHFIEVEASARDLARALREVLSEPGASFGAISLKRPADRLGRPFETGDRFHGCLSIAGRFAWPPLRAVARAIEDRFLSDYCELTRLDENGFEYRYLEGTPVRGRSDLKVEPLGPSRCRVVQVFEYQETSGIAIEAIQRFGLRRHDLAFRAQVERAAARIGARVGPTSLQDTEE